MRIKVCSELREIFSLIKKMNLSETEWSQKESSDMFQTDRFCGGFDATEGAFLFSFYDKDDNEYWFHFKLDDVMNNKIESFILEKVT